MPGSVGNKLAHQHITKAKRMTAQRDLVEIVHTLTQVLNYKGC